MEPTFRSICEVCPAFTASAKLGEIGTTASAVETAAIESDAIEFIYTLLKQKDPIKNRVFFTPLSDISLLYCKLTHEGRTNADTRIYHGLKIALKNNGIMFYAGSGVFLFFILDQEESRIIATKKKVLETIFSLIGHTIGAGGSDSSDEKEVDINCLLGSAFKTDFDIEDFIKRSIGGIAGGSGSAAGGDSKKSRIEGTHLTLQIFDRICKQVAISYMPVWHARTQMVSIYRADAVREIEPHVTVSGDRILTRGRRDPFHYRFQMYKFNTVFSNILSWESQNNSAGMSPVILLPFSYASMIEISSDDFEKDIKNIIGFHSADKIALLISDIDENMPLRHLLKTLNILTEKRIGIYLNIPLNHSYSG